MRTASEYRQGNLSKVLLVVNTVLRSWSGGEARQRGNEEEGWREMFKNGGEQKREKK